MSWKRTICNVNSKFVLPPKQENKKSTYHTNFCISQTTIDMIQ